MFSITSSKKVADTQANQSSNVPKVIHDAGPNPLDLAKIKDTFDELRESRARQDKVTAEFDAKRQQNQAMLDKIAACRAKANARLAEIQKQKKSNQQ